MLIRTVFYIMACSSYLAHHARAGGLYTDSLGTDRAGRWAVLWRKSYWLRADNSAGIGQYHGNLAAWTSLSGGLENGEFARPQQPGISRIIRFDSERYASIKKINVYGGFRFRQKWEEGIRWSNMLDPFRGTPYIVADSLGGDWKKQEFGLSSKLATNKLFSEKLSLGIGLDYDVETGARQNDPRPLNYSRNLKLSPGLTWLATASIRTGLGLSAGFFREETEMENRLPTAQKQYRLKGLSIHDAPTIFSLSVNRAYAGRGMAGEYQFEKIFKGARWMSSAGYKTYLEDTYDGITKPTLGGRFKNDSWNLNTLWRQISQKGYQEFSAAVKQQKGSGREYHQTYNTETTRWITTFEAVFYKSEALSLQLGYTRELFTGDGLTTARRMTWSAQWQRGRQQYLYNQISDQKLSFGEAGFCVEQLLFKKHSGNLNASLSGTYHFNVYQDLKYPARSTNARAARELLYPDHAYQAADYVMLSLHTRYAFYLGTMPGTQFFISANVQIQRITRDQFHYFSQSGRNSFQVTLGAFY